MTLQHYHYSLVPHDWYEAQYQLVPFPCSIGVSIAGSHPSFLGKVPGRSEFKSRRGMFFFVFCVQGVRFAAGVVRGRVGNGRSTQQDIFGAWRSLRVVGNAQCRLLLLLPTPVRAVVWL